MPHHGIVRVITRRERHRLDGAQRDRGFPHLPVMQPDIVIEKHDIIPSAGSRYGEPAIPGAGYGAGYGFIPDNDCMGAEQVRKGGGEMHRVV